MKYQYENNKHCRWCGVSDETIQHIVSCGSDGPVISDVERMVQEGNNLEQMKNIAERIENFLDRVEVQWRPQVEGQMKDMKDAKKQNIENEVQREIEETNFNVSSPPGFKVLYISVL